MKSAFMVVGLTLSVGGFFMWFLGHLAHPYPAAIFTGFGLFFLIMVVAVAASEPL